MNLGSLDVNVHRSGWRSLLYVLYVRALVKQLPNVSPALSILSARPIVFLLGVLPRRAAEGSQFHAGHPLGAARAEVFLYPEAQ